MTATKRRNIVIIILILLALLLLVGMIWYFVTQRSNKTADSNVSALSDCTSLPDEQPEVPSGWKTSLYAAPLQDTSSNDNVPDNGVRVFSISGIKSKSDANDIYYRIQRINNDDVAGTKVVIEVCNGENKAVTGFTTATTATSETSANTAARVTSMHGGLKMPDATGTYRVDAYAYFDGAWHFTNRIDAITLNN